MIQDGGKTAHRYDGLAPIGFIRLQQVLRVIPVSRASWWAGIAKGIYPKGVKLGANTTAWRVDDIRALIARINAQISEKDSKGVA